jgi:hypothetical protein
MHDGGSCRGWAGPVHELTAGRFSRAEPRAWGREYVSGLVAGVEQKNGWTPAEWAGEVSPDGAQRLLRRPDWDVDGVRDDVRDYVLGQLGDVRRDADRRGYPAPWVAAITDGRVLATAWQRG